MNYQPLWKLQDAPGTPGGESMVPLRTGSGGFFGIIAGAVSGAIVGFAVAGALTVAAAAFISVAAGLVLGWQAHRTASRR